MERDTKVFVDSDEEITFIVDKLKQAPTPRVALVIPEGASLLRSGVSLKLLKRTSENEEKNIVLVTMDENAKGVCRSLGLKCVARIGDLKPSIWEEEAEPEDRTKKSQKEKDDSTEPAGTVAGGSEKESDEKKFEDAAEDDDLTVGDLIAKEEVPDEPAETSEIDEKLTKDDPKKEEEPKDNSEEMEDFEFITNKELKPTEEVSEREDEDSQETSDRKGVASSVSSFVGGIKAKFGSKPKSISKPTPKPEVDLPEKDEPEEVERKPSGGKRRSTSVDLANYSAGASRSRRTVKLNWSMPKFGGKSRKPPKQDSSRAAKPPKRTGKFKLPSLSLPKSKLGYILGGVLLIGLLGVFVYAYWIAPRVKVTVYKKVKAMETTYAVTGTTSLTPGTVDTQGARIPVTQHGTLDNYSSYREITNEEPVGEKSSGEVSIYNLTPKKLTIQNGTTLTCTTSGCKNKTYKTLGSLTVQPGSSDKVNIEATEIGEEYNSGIQQNFKVGNYNSNSQAFARNLSAITGGEARTVKVVTQEDKDALKDEVESNLTESCKNKMRRELGEGTIVIDSSITTEISEESFDKDVGAESDLLNLSMTMECTALIYTRTDLVNLTKELLLAEIPEGFNVDEEGMVISETVQNAGEDSVTFDVFAQASAKPELDQTALKEQLKGVSLQEAEQILAALENTERYEVSYYPDWSPGFMKRIPTNEKDIIVEMVELKDVI